MSLSFSFPRYFTDFMTCRSYISGLCIGMSYNLHSYIWMCVIDLADKVSFWLFP